jgi:hypothetical protein
MRQAYFAALLRQACNFALSFGASAPSTRLRCPFRLAMRQGRFQAGWKVIKSAGDRQAWQSLLQVFHASVGDLGAAEVELR